MCSIFPSVCNTARVRAASCTKIVQRRGWSRFSRSHILPATSLTWPDYTT
jgi:hypothetical protein